MSNAETLGVTYDEAFTKVSDSLAGLERAVNAALLTIYPDRDNLAQIARDAQRQTEADAVQVNAIVNGKQITLMVAPGEPVRTTIRDRDSLCVLTVGADEVLWVEDMKNSVFLKNHPAPGVWGSWLSAPIHVNKYPVGAVCALQDEARVWTTQDKQSLAVLADVVGKAVEDWSIQSRKEKEEDGT